MNSLEEKREKKDERMLSQLISLKFSLNERITLFDLKNVWNLSLFDFASKKNPNLKSLKYDSDEKKNPKRQHKKKPRKNNSFKRFETHMDF